MYSTLKDFFFFLKKKKYVHTYRVNLLLPVRGQLANAHCEVLVAHPHVAAVNTLGLGLGHLTKKKKKRKCVNESDNHKLSVFVIFLKKSAQTCSICLLSLASSFASFLAASASYENRKKKFKLKIIIIKSGKVQS